MSTVRPISVNCPPDRDGWHCSVTVGDDPGATRHDVAVASTYYDRVAPSGTTVEDLVEASFAFLLEREPRESILRDFDLAVIGRYFPQYEREIGGRLSG